MAGFKITQMQMAFYTLYQAYKEDKNRFVPTWEFVGEICIKEVNTWVLRSYKCPTRLTDLMQRNPKLLVRKMIKGKSGASYYGYKFVENVSMKEIKDQSIMQFYKFINSI